MTFVNHEELFEKLKVFVRVIEFHKLVMSNSRSIFFMTPASKFNPPNQSFVKTIIPPEIRDDQQPLLRQCVLKHSMCCPCRQLDNFLVSMSGSYDPKHFAHDLVNETGHDEPQMHFTNYWKSSNFGYKIDPWTCRTPEGSSKTGKPDNSDIIPYSSKLSLCILSHLNMKLCVSPIGGNRYPI